MTIVPILLALAVLAAQPAKACTDAARSAPVCDTTRGGSSAALPLERGLPCASRMADEGKDRIDGERAATSESLRTGGV